MNGNPGWLRRSKDAVLSIALKSYLNHHFTSFGKMTTLQLDSQNHTLIVTAELAGESSPIEFRVRYDVESSDTGMAFIPRDFASSREWIQQLGAEILRSDAPRIPIPAGLPTALLKIIKI